MHHTELSDEALVSQLVSLCLEGRRLVARLIVHLIEVEDRGLDKTSACSSMWDFCIRRMRMSEGETSRRLGAMKLVRRFPSLLGRIERGEIHLSALRILGPHLDESNVEELLDAASGKTKLEVQELVARRHPRPDAKAIERKLPAGSASLPFAEPVASGHVEPLSADRYLVQTTLSKAAYENLTRAKDLIRHRMPGGETSEILERALEVLVAKLEKERLGKTSRPQRKPRASKPKPGRIPRAVRREVFERDGEQCTYVDAHGRKCECRTLLELDHIVPRALDGCDEASNLRVRCRAHNRMTAEQVFGKEYVAERIHCRQQQSRCRASVPAETIAQATRGLLNMGFTKTDVRCAVDSVIARHPGGVPVHDLVREAIAALT